jgi:uncharacterized protein YbjT (DUF2867 family)
METVLILGATGNLGGLTAQTLQARQPAPRLRLVSSRESGCSVLREKFPQCEVVQADWYDITSLSVAVAGVDRVFIVTPDFRTDESVVTPNIIRATRAAGTVRQLVRLIAIPPGLTQADLSKEVRATRIGAAIHTIAKSLLDTSGLAITYVNVPCWIMFNLPWFLAGDVTSRRRIAMPAESDAARLWVSEGDVAAIAAKILTDPPEKHIGQEYRLTGERRYTFAQLAHLLSDVVGEQVTYVDDDASLRRIMGDDFPALMTYFGHETRDYACVPVTDTIRQLLGRPPVSLQQYLEANRSVFD